MNFTSTLLGQKPIQSFLYEEIGVKGVGKYGTPMINMDNYIDHSNDDELHIEACMGLAACTDFKFGMVVGSVPQFERDRFGGIDNWSEVLSNIEQYDPTGVHKKALLKIIDANVDVGQQLYKYAYFAMGAPIPWFFACYLKTNDFATKTQDKGAWTENARHFPKIVEYVKTLPFKEVGRVLFFTTYPNAGVVTHRDSIVADHRDHNINLFFSDGRPSFVWDEVTKQKTYLDPSAKSYFFNNRDYHGVDPEPKCAGIKHWYPKYYRHLY